MTQAPSVKPSRVFKRAFDNGYRKAIREGKSEAEAVQAGKLRALKAVAYVERQRSQNGR